MRFIYVAQEAPYPPSHGARVDIWRRIKGLHDLNHSTFLITWLFDDVSEAEKRTAIEVLGRFTESVQIYPMRRRWMSALPRLLWATAGWPSHMSARVLSSRLFTDLLSQARLFNADAIFLDGIHGFWIASRLAKHLSLPLVYRAHNREYLYLSGQRRLSRTLPQFLKLTLATTGLRRQEIEVYRQSLAVLDISLDDLAYWRSEGYENGLWLPPLADDLVTRHGPTVPIADFAYLGNLVTPNNISGLIWFIGEIWPIIIKERADATLVIGGSNPSDEIVLACQRTSGILLKANVPNPQDILFCGRVLINPVRMGSGVNMKMIDMLSTGIPVVTTSQGVSGLPSNVRTLTHVCDDERSFAASCLSLIESQRVTNEAGRLHVEQLFGVPALRRAMESVEQACSKYALNRAIKESK